MGLNYNIEYIIKIEKLKNKMISRSRNRGGMKMWMMRLVSMVLIWCCAIHFFTFYHNSELKLFTCLSSSTRLYENNGYLMVSTNGGLNQMRAGICDMVTIARYLNVTLVVPELDKTSFWKDESKFEDVFDVHYFINSLRDEVKIVEELPPNVKNEIKSGKMLSMPPISWSNMTYYYNIVLPRIKSNKVVHFNKSDSRLANNGIPIEVQKFRCRVNYRSLRFTPAIQKLGKRIINILKSKGPFLALHLRYEMDMLAFSGCTKGCNARQVKELTTMRYAYPWWKEKIINGTEKRKAGECPLTPEETSLILQALGIDPNFQLYIAAGDIYDADNRLQSLAASFPNLVKKETLLQSEELSSIVRHPLQMAALDYVVSLESDVFVATYGGNMAKLVEGHRRILGYRKTINLDRRALVNLIDQYRKGSLCWNDFLHKVKFVHKTRMTNIKTRLKIPGKPKLEDFFYSNPEECLP